MDEKIELTPSQYFEGLKGAKKNITLGALKKSYPAFIELGEKYRRLGQVESLKKLCFLADTLMKEEKLIELGITTYVYKDAVEDYIENVAGKAVKIIELSRYMREVPDEFVEVVEKTSELFDQFYVVFTDYTGREERKVEKERRDKDPILFGVFKDGTSVSDRFYFLGDWVDEYCDLTLDKMVSEYTEAKGYSPRFDTVIPDTSSELVGIMRSYKVEAGSSSIRVLDEGEEVPLAVSSISVPQAVRQNGEDTGKRRFFEKIRTIFSIKK